MENALDRASELLDRAQQAGADAAEVYFSSATTRPVSFEANRLKQLDSNQSEGLALRLWRDGRPGLAVAYGASDPAILVEKAIALSTLTDPEPVELAASQTLDFPTTGQAVSVDTLIDLGKSAIATLRAAYPDIICNGGGQSEFSQTLLLNSRGFQGQYASYTNSFGLGVEWVRGEDFLGVYEEVSSLADLDPQLLLDPLQTRLAWAQQSAIAPTGQVPVLLTPKAAMLLWELVTEALNGQQVQEQASPWSQRLGETVAATNLTVRQDPTQGSDRPPIDDEGTPTRSLNLITNGQLEQFYCDRAIGRKLGIPTTGNGFRSGLGRPPTPGLINCLITPGSQSFSELLQTIDRGIVVDQVLGNEADLSGELSVNVELGYAIAQGEILGRVKDTMLAGNVYTVLQNPLIFGHDVQWCGDTATPSVMTQGFTLIH